MITLVDISIDQLVKVTVSLDFNLIKNANIPLSKDQQLIDLFGEVLNSQFNANFNFIISSDLGVQLLEVLTLTVAEASVLPQFIQRNQQFTRGSRSTNGKREVLNSPVNIANVNERLENAKLLDFSTIDQAFQTGILNEER